MSICPKNKSSKGRRDKRRANWKMSAPTLVKCSKCGGRQWIALSNDGRVPDSTVTEGGGLSNLRHRVEISGGRMTVQSLPEFSLVIEIPKVGMRGG